MRQIVIELPPETASRLEDEAREQGLNVEDYARGLVLNSFSAPASVYETLEQEKPRRSIMELHGLGADIWKDNQGHLVDAQEYVDDLRDEWDHRP